MRAEHMSVSLTHLLLLSTVLADASVRRGMSGGRYFTDRADQGRNTLKVPCLWSHAVDPRVPRTRGSEGAPCGVLAAGLLGDG
jgi:hypothetical protein